METIYTVKVRSNQDVSSSYPSERRYSASKVLGLTIVYVALAFIALLFTAIIFIVMDNCAQLNVTSSSSATTVTIHPHCYAVAQDLGDNNATMQSDDIRFVAHVTAASILLFVGSLISSAGGFLAWKRWYIDANIKWFFVTSCITVLLTSVSTTLLTWTIVVLHYYNRLHDDRTSSFVPFYHITVNVYIASLIAVMWSLISIKISYTGMNSPRDHWKMNVPPDIINHFNGNGAGQQNVVIKCLSAKEEYALNGDDVVGSYVESNSNNSMVSEKILNK